METMSLGMDVFAQPSYLPSSSWILQPSRSGCWTLEENKIFERALAIYDKETPDRWQRVAEMIPGKSVEDVRKHYQNLEDDVSHIEAGLVPIPGYSSSSFTVDWGNGQVFDGLTQCNGSKRPGGRASDPERKKGVPWTEEEHRLFLMGLKKYGKGDWRNISRNFVITRTPTQVASHAQKYFIRLGSGGKDKRRSSIHDITTASLGDDQPPSPSQMHMLSVHPSSVVSPERSDQFSVITDSNQSKEAETVFATMASSQLSSSMLMQPSGNGTNSYGVKLEDQDLHSDNLHESTRRHQNILFQMQSAHHHPRG